MTKDDVNNLNESFIIEWWCEGAYAHGNMDIEHYGVKYFDAKAKKLKKTTWCCSDGCGDLPFNVEEEIDLMEDMGKRKYWISKGVKEEHIKCQKQ